MRAENPSTNKLPLRWTGILFAMAANLLFMTMADWVMLRFGNSIDEYWLSALFLAPLLAGILTALYAGYRGAMHAFLGGMISIPILALFILGGAWQPAIMAGAFCTLGGAFTEIWHRRRKR